MARIGAVGDAPRATARALAAAGATFFGNLVAASLPSAPADDVPGQLPPPWIHARSDPFARRVEELVAQGAARDAAESQAREELLPEGSTECLGYTFVVIWCEDGVPKRAYKRITSNCIDEIASTAGCTALTCPPGWAPPAPCPLPSCPPPRIPMWDTAVDPVCAGLPATVGAVWMYPTAPTPSWGPCEGLLGCSCFPELDTSCATLVIECRNPAAPMQIGDPCPDGQQD